MLAANFTSNIQNSEIVTEKLSSWEALYVECFDAFI